MLPLEQIDKALPQNGLVLDLGCGEGVISKYLARQKKRNVIGMDLDIKRVQKSNQDNLKFMHGNVLNYNTKTASGVVISDVLHHMNFQKQDQLLKNISINFKKGGVLVVKEVDREELVRSRLTRFWDFIFYPMEKIYFSKSKDLLIKLIHLGFDVKIKKECRFFPGSTTLFVCKKL